MAAGVPVDTLKSVRAIPLPPELDKSLAGAHSVPLHFSTWPVDGVEVLTFPISPRVLMAPPNVTSVQLPAALGISPVDVFLLSPVNKLY